MWHGRSSGNVVSRWWISTGNAGKLQIYLLWVPFCQVYLQIVYHPIFHVAAPISGQIWMIEFDIECDSLSIYIYMIYVYSNIKHSVSRQTYYMVLPYCDSRSAIGGYRHPLTRRCSKADCPVKSRSFQLAGSCIFLPQKLRRTVAIKTEMISVILVP